MELPRWTPRFFGLGASQDEQGLGKSRSRPNSGAGVELHSLAVGELLDCKTPKMRERLANSPHKSGNPKSAPKYPQSTLRVPPQMAGHSTWRSRNPGGDRAPREECIGVFALLCSNAFVLLALWGGPCPAWQATDVVALRLWCAWCPSSLPPRQGGAAKQPPLKGGGAAPAATVAAREGLRSSHRCRI